MSHENNTDDLAPALEKKQSGSSTTASAAGATRKRIKKFRDDGLPNAAGLPQEPPAGDLVDASPIEGCTTAGDVVPGTEGLPYRIWGPDADARVYGGSMDPEKTPIDRAVFETVIKVAIGKHEKDEKWRVETKPFGAFVTESLAKHHEGKKDGWCFVPGSITGGKRIKTAIDTLYMLGVDIDNGRTFDDLCETVSKSGLCAVVYSTHSSGKNITEVQKTKMIDWIKGKEGHGREPLVTDVVPYLLDVRSFERWVLEDACLLEQVKRTNGVNLVVQHREIEKSRLVFILEKPFDIATRSHDPRDGFKEWPERIRGLCEKYGFPFDAAATDVSRLFFLPRHDAGKAEEQCRIAIFNGAKLDIESVPRVSDRPAASDSNPFLAAAEKASGGTVPESDVDLVVFAHGGTLLFADLYQAYSERSRQAGMMEGMCPFDEEHETSAGDPDDHGFYCTNGDGDIGFAAGCMHATCKRKYGNDRLPYVRRFCRQNNLTGRDLEPFVGLEKGAVFVLDRIAAEEATLEQAASVEAGRFASQAAAEAAIAQVTKDSDPGAVVDIVGRVGRTLAFDDIVTEMLLKRLSKASGLALKTLAGESRKARDSARARVRVEAVTVDQAQPQKKAAALDDDTTLKLHQWNRDFAVVRLGSKTRVLFEPDGAAMTPPMMEPDAFRLLMANDKVRVPTSDGDERLEPTSKVWFEWPDRRDYKNGIVFEPQNHKPKTYNLWRGFPVKGREGSWGLLRGHLYENVCQSNDEYFNWAMTWLAQIFQQPGIKLGSAFCLIGKKGTGKSKMFDWIRKAMGQHAIKVAQRDHITGRFNSHQVGIILMICEEAFWAGDSSAGGVLKDLITSDVMLSEAKNIDILEVANYCRLALVSNEKWVVPAGLEDERRFFVLECGEGRRQDIEFFIAVDNEMESGGLEAMVAELETWEPAKVGLTWNSLRTPPKTAWLQQQAEQGTSLGDRFFKRLIGDGEHDIGDGMPLKLEDWGDGEKRAGSYYSAGKDEQTVYLIPIAEMRNHYSRFVGSDAQNTRNRRAPGDDEMMSLATHYLGATTLKPKARPTDKDRVWQVSGVGKCIAVPNLRTIQANAIARGIAISRTTFDQEQENEERKEADGAAQAKAMA